MDILIVLLGVITALALLGLAAEAWGVDSRPGFSDPRRSPEPPGITA